MKNRVVSALSGALCLSTLLFPMHAQADGFKFTPRASLSIASYEFTQSPRPGALAPTGINGDEFPQVEFEVTFKILGVGGTFINGPYYIDVAFQQSLKEEDDFSLTDPAIALPGNTFTETFKGDRSDSSITLGRKFLDNKAAMYIGYKMGKSEADGNQGQHLSFEEEGFFIGANYAWRLTDKGALSINLAYADLNGDLAEQVTNPAFDGLTVPLDTDASSNAQGLSYGVTWSSRLSDSLSYSFGIDARSYTFEDVTDSNPNAIPSKEFEEKFITTSLSLFYLF